MYIQLLSLSYYSLFTCKQNYSARLFLGNLHKYWKLLVEYGFCGTLFSSPQSNVFGWYDDKADICCI